VAPNSFNSRVFDGIISSRPFGAGCAAWRVLDIYRAKNPQELAEWWGDCQLFGRMDREYIYVGKPTSVARRRKDSFTRHG
jgi:hypothetical protein